uniref:Uncharacterized protein n=1 Tax=Neogobius melanostomus TaxID=47308 RepID=A0A8C6SA54_9GOBI
MAEKQLDREAFMCPICLDLLENPVTISCGHSFCMKCLQDHWDQQVECNVPSCVVSFCESHLQPHRDVTMLQKHQLVAPSNKLQENICHEHNKLKEIFCRTDQLLICYLCCIDQHKGHDTVSSAAERAHRQEELEAKTDLLKNRVQHKEANLQRLQQEAQDINRCAQRAVQRSGDMFKEVIQLLEKRRSEVEQQIRSEEQIQLGRVQKLQDQLQQDVTELKRSISELEELSNIPDHNQFILRCLLLSTDPETTKSKTPTSHQRYFEDVTRALSVLGDKLKFTLREFEIVVQKFL